jgi:hypothetical protein
MWRPGHVLFRSRGFARSALPLLRLVPCPWIPVRPNARSETPEAPVSTFTFFARRRQGGLESTRIVVMLLGRAYKTGELPALRARVHRTVSLRPPKRGRSLLSVAVLRRTRVHSRTLTCFVHCQCYKLGFVQALGLERESVRAGS